MVSSLASGQPKSSTLLIILSVGTRCDDRASASENGRRSWPSESYQTNSYDSHVGGSSLDCAMRDLCLKKYILYRRLALNRPFGRQRKETIPFMT
jgi:hypothetical protein